MAGIVWNRNINQLVGEVQEWIEDLEDGWEQTMEQAVSVAQSSMIRQQRVETGHMRAEISGKTTRTEKTITGEWGWLDTPEDYFYYQEYGFDHIGGKHIEGMFSLRASLDEAEEVLRDWA